MFRSICIVPAFAIIIASLVYADTWQLGADKQWHGVDKAEGTYLAASKELKDAIASGDKETIQDAVVKFRMNSPELAGDDFQAYIDAELMFAKGKWTKASEAFDKFLDEYPTSWLADAVMERRYELGNAFLEGQRRKVLGFIKVRAYDDGANILRDVADRSGDGPIAKRSFVTLAEGYEELDRYDDAYDAWADMSAMWPTGEEGRQSLYGMARSMHSSYRGPLYDSANLKSANGYYNLYAAKYPQDAEDKQVDSQKDQLVEQLAYKEYSIGAYYFRTGSLDAARVYYQYVLDKWPDSVAANFAKRDIEAVNVRQVTLEASDQKDDTEKSIAQRFMSFFDFL